MGWCALKSPPTIRLGREEIPVIVRVYWGAIPGGRWDVDVYEVVVGVFVSYFNGLHFRKAVCLC